MTRPITGGPFEALQTLTLEQVEQRLLELDAERASLSLIRRSLAAKERTRRRNADRRQEVPRG